MNVMKSAGMMFVVATTVLIPLFVFAGEAATPGAGGLIPCAGPDCNFSHVIQFVNTIVDWLIRIAIPVSAVLFTYAGFLYLTSGGNASKKTQANKVFQSVLWGFVMAISAWIVVNFVTTFLIGKSVNEVITPPTTES